MFGIGFGRPIKGQTARFTSSFAATFVVSVVVGVVWVVASSRVVERIVVIVQLVAGGRAILLALPSFSFSFCWRFPRFRFHFPVSHDGGSAAAYGPRALAS